MPDRAVMYLRVSTAKQDEENQRKSIKELIEQKGWTLAIECGDKGVYKDHGISAYKDDVKRPDFERMIGDAKKRKFEHIVCFNLDRFSRQNENEVLDLIKSLRLAYNVEVNAVFGDEWKQLIDAINNLPNMGYLGKGIVDFLETVIRGLQAHQSRRESEKISERVLESKKFQKARDEKRIGRPKIDEDILAIVIELLIENIPYSGIVSQLEVMGYGIDDIPSEPKVSMIRKSNFKNPITKNDVVV